MQLGSIFTDEPVGNGWDTLQPHGLPRVTFPLRGDSIFSGRDIIYFDLGTSLYVRVPLGTYPNLQPWSSQQSTIMIEQDFMVRQENYKPIRLNTYYDEAAWSLGWTGTFPDGVPIPSLSDCLLVDSSPLEDMGDGICRLTMRFVSLPFTRNEMEQFCYTYPGLSPSRLSFTRVVPSRIQYDYFLFDDWGVTALPVFPAGPKLNAATGIYPVGLILDPQLYYAPDADALANNYFIPRDGSLIDATLPALSTIPSKTDYISFFTAGAELVAEASTFDRWMGNIFVRRTRFVPAQ
jgi:hypothetical protein